jgi:hypothetical protein
VRRFNHPATQSVTTPLRLNTTNPAA